MSAALTDRASTWVYRGVWGMLARWFRVPQEPPNLPADHGEIVERFRPDEGYLRYLKFWFWVVLLPMDLPVFIVWGILAAFHTGWAIALLPVALVIAFLPDVIAYVAIHLKYDTTWYVVSDRTLRIRRGVMTVTEMTITFENVQNVKVRQGPIERRFGFGDVVVETAGVRMVGAGEGMRAGANEAVIRGVADLEGMKARILQHVRASKSAGLGDERQGEAHGVAPTRSHAGPAWTREHMGALRAILDELRALRATGV